MSVSFLGAAFKEEFPALPARQADAPSQIPINIDILSDYACRGATCCALTRHVQVR